MKVIRSGKARGNVFVLVAAGIFAVLAPAGAQHVKIERCEPMAWRAGQSVEVHLGGRGLERASLWTSFPAMVERIDEKAPRFRITSDFVGDGAIRAHSDEGVSNLFFVRAGSADEQVISCEKRTRSEDAQVIEVPAVIDGTSAQRAAHFYRFAAKKGQVLVVHGKARGSGFDGVITIREAASGRRLVQNDDSEIHGADPWLRFVAPREGEYIIELIDSQYRGGQAFRLEVGAEGAPSVPEKVADMVIHQEGGEEPRSLPLTGTVQGGLEVANDVDAFSFKVPSRSFLTITPQTRVLHSPVTPRLRLTKADGQVLAETPQDAFDERALRLWIDQGENYLLTVSDAFGRHGRECSYRIELNGDTVPYELTIPGQKDKKHPLRDKFLAVPGGVFEIPVHCRRHQFESAVNLSVNSDLGCALENGVLKEKQGDLNLRVRVPRTAPVSAGTLASVRLSGVAESGGRTYEQTLRTRAVLEERDPGARIPENADGLLAVRIIESPLTVEVSPPEGVARGASVKIPVKLVWGTGKRKFHTTLRLSGLPGGVQCGEKKLNDKDTSTGLELKVANPSEAELTDLRVEVRLDYHKQSLLVESEPFAIRIAEKDEE